MRSSAAAPPISLQKAPAVGDLSTVTCPICADVDASESAPFEPKTHVLASSDTATHEPTWSPTFPRMLPCSDKSSLAYVQYSTRPRKLLCAWEPSIRKVPSWFQAARVPVIRSLVDVGTPTTSTLAVSSKWFVRETTITSSPPLPVPVMASRLPSPLKAISP